MPKAYRGRFMMACAAETCARERSRANVAPDCLDCRHAIIAVLDLDERTITAKRPSAPGAEAESDAAGAASDVSGTSDNDDNTHKKKGRT
ncbi:MAG: hypothetical protein PHW08_07155 [Kiritimatiellae bacterium]|nr:hypothetical protein [Kiritimatiellia bacterium]